eukprot:GHVN01012968.1.p1 GENE.GHVN01012968.1~~GHVN01012968.1.p1  ORF type:complete len:293 (+),score=39.88 GHVN01012968.1:901-1779(+)
MDPVNTMLVGPLVILKRFIIVLFFSLINSSYFVAAREARTPYIYSTRTETRLPDGLDRDCPYGHRATYTGDSFFNERNFWFFTDNDPTGGYVNYVPRETAALKGYISVDRRKHAVIRTDTQSKVLDSARGRDSVRLTSRSTFDDGLIVFSINHMPTGCGTWPAFWTVGHEAEQPWPELGEIDIIEGANNQVYGHNALHTSNGCDMWGVDHLTHFDGQWSTAQDGGEARNCYAFADLWNVGCAIDSHEENYGAPLNAIKGGYYVMELNRTEHIKVREPIEVIEMTRELNADCE